MLKFNNLQTQDRKTLHHVTSRVTTENNPYLQTLVEPLLGGTVSSTFGRGPWQTVKPGGEVPEESIVRI